MATTNRVSRFISNADRVRMRDTYGNVSKVLDAAHAEYQAGRLDAACAAFHEAIGQALRERFVEVTGRDRSTIFDSEKLLIKLRSGTHIDNWSFKAIGMAIHRPKRVSWLHADVMGAIAGSLSLATEGGA